MAITSKCTGYVKVEGEKEDIEVDARHLHTALHGDTVLLALHPKMHRRLSGEVVKILKRAKLDLKKIPKDEYAHLIKDLTGQMELASANLEFEKAAELRDIIADIKAKL